MEFSYYLPVNIQFGAGRVDEIGKYAHEYGSKALIVTGKSSAKKTGLYDRVVKHLASMDIEYSLFDEVEANPLTTTALRGASRAKVDACDMVIALGGGSIMDCAKAIAFMAVNDGDINDYIFNRASSDRALPLIVVPTTCGTGSEGNGFAVLTNPDNGDKKSLRCNAIVPKVSIVDPDLMRTIPFPMLGPVVFDALCHNLEAYTANMAQPFTDALALYALRLLAGHMVPLYQHVKSLSTIGQGMLDATAEQEAWMAVTLASTIGGIVINTAGVTLGHGLEHPVSGLKDITHGVGLAVLEPLAVAFSWQGNPRKFGHVAEIFGGHSGADLASCLYDSLQALDLITNLSALGVGEGDIPWLVDNCFKIAAGNLANTPADISRDDLLELYAKAL